jgi:hypothetical protein
MTILYGVGAFPLECRLRLLARGKAELMEGQCDDTKGEAVVGAGNA